MSLLKIILMCLLYCSVMALSAQNDSIEPLRLTCRVVDEKTKKPVEFASVKLIGKSVEKQKYTDSTGMCYFDSLSSGTFALSSSFTGYAKVTLTNIVILKSRVCNLELRNKPSFPMHGQPAYYELIEKDEPTHDQFNSRQIMRMPY